MLGTKRILRYPHNVYPSRKDKFYVYALCKPCGSVFYIGKGKGDRINKHFQPSSLRGNSPKIGVIKKYGNSIRREILAYFDTEDSAYEFEEYLIAYYGLKSEGGQLTNYAKTRYEYSNAFVKDVSSQGHKHRKNKYTEEQVFQAYRLYYEDCLPLKEIEHQTGISSHYLPYLMRGKKRPDLYKKYYESGLVKNLRTNGNISEKRYSRITDEQILTYYRKHQEGEISIIAAAKELGVRASWLSSVFNGRERKHLELTVSNVKRKPRKFKDASLPLEIRKLKSEGLSVSEIIARLGISKTHFYRKVKEIQKMPKGDEYGT